MTKVEVFTAGERREKNAFWRAPVKLVTHAVLALLAPDAQPRFPIHAMHSFVVHIFSAAS